jgi:hypothetical protein
MDKQTIYWVKAQLTNDENASNEEMRAYFIEGWPHRSAGR